MKKIFILSNLFILIFSVNFFAQKKTATARQLFMSLPNEYVNGDAKERLTFLVFPQSIKPDFLTFMITDKAVPKAMANGFSEPQAIGDLRVFRGKSNTIVGLRYQIGDGKETNPTADNTRVVTVLLENKNGKWTNVTDRLLPKVSTDAAYKVLTDDFQMKDVRKEDVWVETQIRKDGDGLLSVARIKGNDAVTTLKWFKWTGSEFIETVIE